IDVRTAIVWDKDRGDIVERIERRLGAMLLDSRLLRPPAGEETTAALVDRIRATRLGVLRWSATAMDLRRRIGFLRTNDAAHEWPDWSDTALVKTLDEWLA